MKLLTPTPRAVNPDVAEVGVVMVPAPEINVHKPVPTAGGLPARVAVVAHIVWSGPAAAGVGNAAIVILTSSVATQAPSVMVHRKIAVAPITRPVSPEVGLEGVVIVPMPEINVQAPVPAPGVFPASVAVVMLQSCWSGPALIKGTAPFIISTSSKESGQGAFEIVQRKVEVPANKPVRPEFGLEGVVILPLPAINVHTPDPTPGILPANVVVLEQIVWSGPAAAGVGTAETVIITVSEVEGQGALEIVQRKLLAPTPRAVNPDVAEVGVVMVPAPEINVHKPVPGAGALPARVAVVAHIA